MNKSIHGFYYDTDAMRFASFNDRQTAIDALLNVVKRQGLIYSRDQIGMLSDSMILSILDSDSDNDVSIGTLIARLSLLLDPNNKTAHLYVVRALRKQNQLSDASERQLIYDLIVKYFNAMNSPIQVPIDQWSDMLLIRTFKTLQMPGEKEFLPPTKTTGSIPNVAIPISSS